MSSVDLGAIVRATSEEYLSAHGASAEQCKALRAIAACRTERLGGERQMCDRCGFEHMVWRSCRNRHCPRCQAAARAEWLDQRREELLPVPYFHVVFTVPAQLNVLARWAPRLFYSAMFHSAGQALIDISRTKLKIEPGALCVLHTWGQTLVLHPHIHCVVPGGGFAAGGAQWRSVRKPSFFLPVKVLSRRFRTLLCAELREQWRDGRLNIPEHIVANAGALEMLLVDACRQEWVVHSKPPFGGPRQVLAYLAGYTHRIAISNRRLVAFDGENVTFRYRDYRDQSHNKTMVLSVAEFLRRFLQHVVPSRFVRIRYYGFLANRVRRRSLARARELLRCKPPAPVTTHAQVPLCPKCRQGHMIVTDYVPPHQRTPGGIDSS